MDKKYSYEKAAEVLRKSISQLFNVNVLDENADLFLEPYSLSACDMAYVLSLTFEELGLLKRKFDVKKIESASFHSIHAIAAFLISV